MPKKRYGPPPPAGIGLISLNSIRGAMSETGRILILHGIELD